MEISLAEVGKIATLVRDFETEDQYSKHWVYFFETLNKVDLNSYYSTRIASNFYVDIISLVFKNPTFNKNVLEALQQEDVFLNSEASSKLNQKDRWSELAKIGIENKKHISTSIIVAFSPLTALLPVLTKRNLSFIKKVVLSNVFHIQKFQNWEFTTFKIVSLLQDSVYRTRFVSESFRSKEKYFNFRDQNRLVASLLLLESTKVACITDLFKRIDREKTLKGVSVSRLRNICNMIWNYRAKKSNVINDLRAISINEPELANELLDNLSNKNEENIIDFLEIFSNKYVGVSREESILKGLAYAPSKSAELLELGKQKLRAFSGEVSDEYAEWSNKIYLTCQKALGIFIAIRDAQDVNWKIRVFNRELFDWFSEVYIILNKLDLEDDWREVEKFITEENDQVEWKASFISPVETPQGTPKDQMLEIGKKLLEDNILKTMIAMMNTKGGSILVGLVEHPERIKHPDFLNNTVNKNGRIFFDINFDLRFNGMNLDALKLLIQDKLKKLTGLSEDYFNDLWSLTPLSIKKDERSIEVYKITINKSAKPVYHKDSSWITLAKRANAKTIFTDPAGRD